MPRSRRLSKVLGRELLVADPLQRASVRGRSGHRAWPAPGGMVQPDVPPQQRGVIKQRHE